jgi:hypothetical protein
MLSSTMPASAVPARGIAVVALGAVLGLWFGVVALLSHAGLFVTEAAQPPLALLTAVILPIAMFAIAYLAFEPFRRFVREGNPVLLTNVQSWRILGGTFVVLLSFGLLPATFALPAGLGDMAIGITAPFIARLVGTPFRWRPLFTVWQVLGILDLVVAVGTGAGTRAFPQLGGGSVNGELMIVMSQLPLSLIPTFAVPLFIILHLASLAQVRAN